VTDYLKNAHMILVGVERELEEHREYLADEGEMPTQTDAIQYALYRAVRELLYHIEDMEEGKS